MKKICLIFTLIFVLSGFTVVQAAKSNDTQVKTFDNKVISDVNKVWIVKFKDNVDLNTVKDNISIKDLSGATLKVDIFPGNASDLVNILPPSGGYKMNHTYQITINKSLKSAKGKLLNKIVTMKFKVSNNPSDYPTPDPQNPGGNTDPQNPGGKTDPQNPGGKTDPQNPGGKTDPQNPGGKTDPQNPGGKTDPQNPGGKTDPQNPGGKTDPQNPGGNTGTYKIHAKIVVSPVLSIFKQIKIDSTTVPSGTKFKFDNSSKIYNIKDTALMVASGDTVKVYILDDSSKVLSTFTLNVSSSNSDMNVQNDN